MRKKENEQETAQDILCEEIQETEKRKKKLPGWVIIPILGVLLLAVFGLPKMMDTKGGKTQVGVVRAEQEDIKQVYSISGIVESETEKIFFSPVNATVSACNVKAGQSVKAGELLVAFDTTNLERDNRQSQLNTLAAKYSSQDAIEQSNRASESKNRAEAQTNASIQNLKNQIQKKQEEIGSLEQQADSAGKTASENAAKIADIQEKMQEISRQKNSKEAELTNLQRELEGMSAGDAQYQSKLSRANQLTTELASLTTDYQSLEAQLAQVGGVDASTVIAALATARQELETMQSNLAELESSAGTSVDTGMTSAQKGNLKVSENLAELAQLNTEELLAKGREGIRAEYDGIISKVAVQEGGQAVQGGELFTLVDNQNVNVILEVPANDYGNLNEGYSADIKIGKNTYKGTVASVDRIALKNEKGNSVIRAIVHIDNPDENLFIGVSAKVEILAAQKHHVLCIPTEVINTSTEGDFVYIIKNGIVKRQMVELGIISGSKVEVVQGLTGKEEVIADTTGNLKEGMKVTGKDSAPDAAEKE